MNRNQLLLVGLIIVLAVAVYIVLQRPGEVGASGSVGAPLAQYDSSAVDKVEIRSTLGEVVLEKQAGKWMVVRPVHYPASEEAITSALGKGRTATLAGLVSSNPEKQAMFQVDTAGTHVRVFEKENLRAAFVIGKPSSTFRENYVRLEGSDHVYLTNELLAPVFARRLDEWREKSILRFTKEDARSIGFRFGDTTFTLAFHDTAWQIGRDVAVEGTVTAFLNTLSMFDTDDFIDSMLTTPPRLTATIDVLGTQVRFHFDRESEKYLVQTSASPQWYEIQSWRANQVLKRRKDFLGTAS